MSLVYPQRCIFCGNVVKDKIIICNDCIGSVKPIGDNICLSCGVDKEYCSCKVGDFAFLRHISYFYYEGAVKTLVKRFKFRNTPQLVSIMSDYMANRINDKYNDFTFDFITFVPSSLMKFLIRGYNPAQLLAQNISKKLDIPLKNVLGAKFRLLPQKYSKQNRRKSVKGKFYVKNIDIKDKRILLIDDIMTSGSTMSECARVMKRAGAKEILCSTFAITCKK